MTVEPRPATAADERLLRAIFVDAFEDDPFFSWMWSTDPAGARAGVQAWMDLVVHRVLGRAEATLSGDGTAAALWIHPDRPLVDDDYAAVGLLLRERIGDRAPAVLAAIGATGAYRSATPHRTLLYVGVRPAAQGRGAGGRVLAPVLAASDAEGIPVALNSTNPRNVPFYSRLGFETLGVVPVADGVELRAMWRNPR